MLWDCKQCCSSKMVSGWPGKVLLIPNIHRNGSQINWFCVCSRMKCVAPLFICFLQIVFSPKESKANCSVCFSLPHIKPGQCDFVSGESHLFSVIAGCFYSMHHTVTARGQTQTHVTGSCCAAQKASENRASAADFVL